MDTFYVKSLHHGPILYACFAFRLMRTSYEVKVRKREGKECLVIEKDREGMTESGGKGGREGYLAHSDVRQA